MLRHLLLRTGPSEVNDVAGGPRGSEPHVDLGPGRHVREQAEGSRDEIEAEPRDQHAADRGDRQPAEQHRTERDGDHAWRETRVMARMRRERQPVQSDQLLVQPPSGSAVRRSLPADRRSAPLAYRRRRREPGASAQIGSRPCSSLVDGYAPPQHRQRLLRGPDLSQSRGGDRKVPFGAAAALAASADRSSTDQALLFEPFERVVHAGEDHAASRCSARSHAQSARRTPRLRDGGARAGRAARNAPTIPLTYGHLLLLNDRRCKPDSRRGT